MTGAVSLSKVAPISYAAFFSGFIGGPTSSASSASGFCIASASATDAPLSHRSTSSPFISRTGIACSWMSCTMPFGSVVIGMTLEEFTAQSLKARLTRLRGTT